MGKADGIMHGILGQAAQAEGFGIGLLYTLGLCTEFIWQKGLFI